MVKPEEVLAFIKHFQNPGTIKTFTEGCCYWFAKILDERFNHSPHSGIFYHSVNNHFATVIDYHIYDITGEIEWGSFTDWVPWEDYKSVDELEYQRIVRDCILKLD